MSNFFFFLISTSKQFKQRMLVNIIKTVYPLQVSEIGELKQQNGTFYTFLSTRKIELIPHKIWQSCVETGLF